MRLLIEDSKVLNVVVTIIEHTVIATAYALPDRFMFS